ncbi:MAG: LemA family protein [Eubacterium sp.]|nr:LemA family protein [Eubacterium sp.]
MWIYIAIGGGVLLLLLIICIANYNRFVRLNKKVDEAFSTMDIYLVKRWELIPKLVDTVKGYMAHERGTLEQIAMLRNRAYEGLSDADKIRTNTELSKNLGQVVAVAEEYPDLKSSDNFLQLASALYQVEDEIAQSRKYYNGTVRMLNTKVETFPGMLFAKMFGFSSREMYEAEAIRRSDVQVKL